MSARIASGLVVLALAIGSAALAQAPSDATIQPGMWQSTETISELVNPMLSAKQIENRMAKPAVVKFCVKSGSLRAMLIGADKAGACTGEVKIGKGEISGARTCTTGLGKGTRTITGTYTATHVETQRETTQDLPQGVAHTKSRTVTTRIGECS